MSSNFSESWLEWAIQIEDEAACDIEAGLDLGQYLGQYLAKSQGYISHEKLMSILQEELGAILSQEDLEVIAKKTENCVRDYIKKKFHNFDVA
jgi:predicted hydrocarbon binding protein